MMVRHWVTTFLIVLVSCALMKERFVRVVLHCQFYAKCQTTEFRRRHRVSPLVGRLTGYRLKGQCVSLMTRCLASGLVPDRL